MKTYLVIGLGVSGSAAARFLLERGEKVVAVDQKADLLKKDPEIALLLTQGLGLFSDEEPLALDSMALAILSPGVSPRHSLVQRVLSRGIEVIGEMEFSLRQIRNRCIGVTGTNGKTTTVLLITHILNTAGIAARALGNVGDSLAEYLLAPDEREVLVLELSSFQLETMKTRCLKSALILNITPDHLDRYETIREYADAKLQIERCLLPGGTLWVSEQVKQEFQAPGELFDSPSHGEFFSPHSTLRHIQLGVPEKQTIQAAFALCTSFGISKLQFSRGLETFRKPEHRIEWVREKNGVSFYNDSKATNIDSVMHAVSLFPGPLILLVGGVDKGASYVPWIDCFRKKVKMVIAFGQAAAKMESELSGPLLFRRTSTMEEAIELSAKSAGEGTSVLLSPGCSSFDQFRNYEHRGDEFKRLVQGLV